MMKPKLSRLSWICLILTILDGWALFAVVNKIPGNEIKQIIERLDRLEESMKATPPVRR